jgi:hypothetical protein
MKELTRKSFAMISQEQAFKTSTRGRWVTLQTEEEILREKERSSLLGSYHCANINIKREILRQQIKNLVDFAEFGLGSEMESLKEIRVPDILELLKYKNVANAYMNWYLFEATKDNLRLMGAGWNSFGKCTFFTLENEEADDDPEERTYSISSIIPKIAGKTMAVTIDAANDGAFVSHLYYHIQKALDADCKRIQVHFPHYDEEENDRVGLLTAVFSETLTSDNRISAREGPLALLAK